MSSGATRQVGEPSPTESRHSLWQAVAHSVRDNVIAEFVVQAVRLGGFILLARALGPDQFGIFRVLLVICALTTLTNEAGIPDALVQRQQVTADHEATGWWLTMTIALCATLILYFAAPLIAAVMEMPGLSVDARLLCLPILLDSTTAVPNARLRRKLQFSALAVADVVAEIAFVFVALMVLWRGTLALVLPAGLIARFIVHAIAIWTADPHFPRGRPTLRAARDIARFSAAAYGGKIVYTLSSNADYVLVGRLLGSSALGFYAMAWDLLRFVPDRLHRVAGRVALSAFCRLQENHEALTRAYLDFVDYIARLVLPIAMCAAIAAPEILGTVYGAKWVPAALPMRLLAPGLALTGLRLGVGSVYYSKNRPALDLYLHGVRLALILIAVLGFARFGLVGVSVGMSLVEGLVSVAAQALACSLLGLGLRDLAKSCIPAFRLTLLCAIATASGKIAATFATAHGATMLISEAVPPAVVYVWFERSNGMDLIGKAFVPRKESRTPV